MVENSQNFNVKRRLILVPVTGDIAGFRSTVGGGHSVQCRMGRDREREQVCD